MDVSRDAQLSERTQRLFDRNANKDRSTSTSDEPMEDRCRSVSAEREADYITMAAKPPQTGSRSVPDSFAPPAFGGSNIDADYWLAHFQRYIEYRQLPDDDVAAMFPLFLKEAAIDWYETLEHRVKNNWKALKEDFNAYFGKSPIDIFFAQETLFTRVQRTGEKVRDYIAQMQKLASKMPRLENDLLLWTILRGLHPQIKAVVIQQQRHQDCS